MDERRWTDRPLAPGERLETPGCVVTRREPGILHLVSGDLAAALDALAPKASLVGFAERPKAPDYALRIGRDTALLVTAAAVDAAPGWHPQGFALSASGRSHAGLDLVGAGAADLLAQGLTAPPPWGSPSAAVQFAGVKALVSGAEDGLTLWVEMGHLTFVSSFLSRCAEGSPRHP